MENTIPPAFKTEAVDEVVTYIENLLRITDSSLLDEWETLKNPDYKPNLDQSLPAPTGPRDITRDPEAFTRLVRNEIFRFLRMLANASYQEIDETFELEQMFPEARWKYTALSNAMDAYYEGHEWIRLDPGARNKGNTNIIESDDRTSWIIEQTLVDNEELNDFQLIFSLSIADAKANSSIKLVPLELKSIAE
ncbi:MAG: hypothetical protein ACI9JZ_001980 [Lentimonas sp.]